MRRLVRRPVRRSVPRPGRRLDRRLVRCAVSQGQNDHTSCIHMAPTFVRDDIRAVDPPRPTRPRRAGPEGRRPFRSATSWCSPSSRSAAGSTRSTGRSRREMSVGSVFLAVLGPIPRGRRMVLTGGASHARMGYAATGRGRASGRVPGRTSARASGCISARTSGRSGVRRRGPWRRTPTWETRGTPTGGRLADYQGRGGPRRAQPPTRTEY
jgi:hypothetical protein